MLGLSLAQQKLLDTVLADLDDPPDITPFQTANEAGVVVATLRGPVKCLFDAVALERSFREVRMGPDPMNPRRTMRESLDLTAIHVREAVATWRGPVLVMDGSGVFFDPPASS
jgi:hypothetical protein